jgi:tRNA threonylcarbamoyladenosine biosynthesis protein TsaE
VKKKVILSNSPDNTKKIARKISKKLKPGDIVCLKGELGSGKTVFVKGIASGLNIKDTVKSSSFVIVNEYKSSKIKLYHVDLYRLNGHDINGLGLEDYLYGNGICIIEWADRIDEDLLPGHWDIRMSWRGKSERKIEIKKAGDKS